MYASMVSNLKLSEVYIMKRTTRSISLFLSIVFILSITSGCGQKASSGESENVSESVSERESDTQREMSEEEILASLDRSLPETEKWRAYEIEFKSDKKYNAPVYSVDMDVKFTNKQSGKSFTQPAFWCGKENWKVRVALTELGEWSYETVCTDSENTGLHGLKGKVNCVPYSGDLEIYKRGFLKVEKGTRYFMYDDGTPFFYLGDTHWTLPLEEIDDIGDISEELAKEYGIRSQFKHIIDYRAEQGYTVIQSQPLGIYSGTTGNSWLGDGGGSIFDYGINNAIVAKFNKLDRFYAYIADKGLVHANSQLAYPEELIETYLNGKIDKIKLEKLCRYWVARFSAYPVLWTTTQEGDNDHYEYGGCTTENNPWIIVMDYVAKYDPYGHPSTCHQENYGVTRVNNSAFKNNENHTWYAAQIFFEDWIAHGKTVNFSWIREYWSKSGSKPVINYESKYDHYQTGALGTRAHAWLSVLNGCSGYGYGVQPIWSLFWAKLLDKDRVNNGVEVYETTWNWVEGLYADGGKQVAGMKTFLEDYEWWNLTPTFGNSKYYKPAGSNYSAATVENRLYIGYFYSNRATVGSHGTFKGMENGQYEAVWFNCVTCEKTEPEIITVTDGTWEIPAKPDKNDWAVALKYIG
ncbi:MAG: DUF4038 domain-containing protein [Ruminococcaceae bacterium]|nr:DUF4038 domain-containing protein [Oscillospiraceae bacterium]